MKVKRSYFSKVISWYIDWEDPVGLLEDNIKVTNVTWLVLHKNKIVIHKSHLISNQLNNG